MSRPPLEDALPAAYPSPALAPERKKILHARLDEAFAEARAEAARRASKRARRKQSPARMLFVVASIGSAGYLSQGIITTTLLVRNSYYKPSNEIIHEITYKDKISPKTIILDTWRQNNNTFTKYQGSKYYLSTKNMAYSIESGKYSEPKIVSKNSEISFNDKVSGIISLSSSHKPYFSGIQLRVGKLLIHIKTALKENYWIDFRGRRTLDISNGVKNQLLLTEYRYNETPPPRIFDPERLKAMAVKFEKRPYSTAPLRPR
jgi:hypothetical protein